MFCVTESCIDALTPVLPFCYGFLSLVLFQWYVSYLLAYRTSLRVSWVGYASFDTTRGAYLAVKVIETFLGDRHPGYACTEKNDEDPTWLKLKWGVAIASRALDWSSCRNGFDGGLVSQISHDTLRFELYSVCRVPVFQLRNVSQPGFT